MLQCIADVLWAHTDCIGTNTASGDGGSSVMSWFLQLWYQNTSTRMNTDSCTGRAVHSGKTFGWKLLRRRRGRGGRIPFLRNLPLFQTAQDAGSSMSYMWIQAGRQDLSSSPFCFSALQDSWTRVEAPGGDSTSSSASGPRDFNTFVFAAISV